MIRDFIRDNISKGRWIYSWFKGLNDDLLIFHSGIQRSGTNYLLKILESNGLYVLNAVDGPRDHYMHKHCRIQKDKSTVVMDYKYRNDERFDSIEEYLMRVSRGKKKQGCFFVIQKDPVNWLDSIVRWGLKCDWLTEEQTCDMNLLSKWLFEWDAYYSEWKMLASTGDDSCCVIIIQYEKMMLGEKIGFENAILEGKNRFVDIFGDLSLASIDRVPQSAKREYADLKQSVRQSKFADISGYVYDVCSSFSGSRIYD